MSCSVVSSRAIVVYLKKKKKEDTNTEPYKAALYHEAEPVFLIMHLIEPAWIDSLKMNQCNDLELWSTYACLFEKSFSAFFFLFFFLVSVSDLDGDQSRPDPRILT